MAASIAQLPASAGRSDAGDWAIVLGVVVGFFAYAGLLVAAIAGSVDALGRPGVVWATAGCRKSVWVWQAVGVVAIPVALAYSGIYFARIRPRLIAAERALGRMPPEDTAWVGERHWYNWWQRARRSPTRWARQARLWWTHALAVVPMVLLAFQQLDFAAHRERPAPGRWLSYSSAAFFIVAAVCQAGRAGFWYAENTRLTGRRPTLGGPLRKRHPPGR